MAGASNTRSSQGSGGRASQKRARPKETKQAQSTPSAAPAATNLRKMASQSQSPPAPPARLSPQMEQEAPTRELSVIPITATFGTPQTFKLLNDRVPSRTGLLAHARQAQNLGIDAIELGKRVPPPPRDQAIMSSPVPQRCATVPQTHSTSAGDFSQHDMHRTMSMPQMPQMHHGLPTQFGGMVQQDMRTSGQQQPQVHPMHTGSARAPNFRGQNTQFYGNSQYMGPTQGQFGAMGSTMATNMIESMGRMGVDVRLPTGYHHPFGQMHPPPPPQQIYHQSPLNYAPAGQNWGMMPGGAPFSNQQIYSGQVANPFNNGQYRPPPPPMEHMNPQMAKIDPSIDPQLYAPNPFMSTPHIEQHPGPASSNMRRPSTQNGPIATPGPAQGIHNEANTTPHPNRGLGSTTQEIKRGVTATPGQNRPAQGIQNEVTATPRPNRGPKLAAQETPSGATATSPANQLPTSSIQENRNRTSTCSQKTTPSNSTIPVTKKVIITLDSPRFDEAFTFPASHEGWYSIAREQLNKGRKLEPDDLYSKICNGNFEVHMINPIFRSKVVWESVQQASGESSNQIEAPSHRLRMDEDASAASTQSNTLELSQAVKGPTTRKEPIAGPSQAATEPKTPMKAPSCPTNQETPFISPLCPTGPEEESPAPVLKSISTYVSPTSVPKPVSRHSTGTKNSDLVPKDLSKLAPQYLESHSGKSHDRQTGKRAAPATEEELSPSKRYKSFNQNAKAKGVAPAASSVASIDSTNDNRKSALGWQSFPGSPFQSMSQYPEHIHFAQGVAQLPAPNPSQLLPPAQDKYIRKSQAQNYVPAHPFNPRSSQPLNSFATSQGQAPKQYAAQIGINQLKNVEHAFNNSSHAPGVSAGMLPWLQHEMPTGLTGLPAQLLQYLQQQSMHSSNIANNQQQQQQSQGFDSSTNAISNQRHGHEAQAIGANDNSDLEEILSGTLDPAATTPLSPYNYSDSSFNSDSDPTSSHLQDMVEHLTPVRGIGSIDFELDDADFDRLFDDAAPDGDEASSHLPVGHADSNPKSDSNSSSSHPETPAQQPQPSPVFQDIDEFPSDNGGFDSFFSDIPVQAPGPFMQIAGNVSPLTRNLYEHQSRGGDFQDILDHEGVHDPAKQQGEVD